MVRIPFSDYVNSSADNVEVAKWRYERIDNLREQSLARVKEEWKQICRSPSKGAHNKSSEIIIDVPPIYRSTLLEVQAQRFRKVEQHEW